MAAYVRDPGGRRATAYGIMVLTIDGSVIGEITGFADPAQFSFFGLPGAPGGLMAYDEDLADRVRAVLPRGAEVTERKMFGGLAFLLGGHMFAGVVGDELMVRLGYQAAQQALERDHVREMDFIGRPMKT